MSILLESHQPVDTFNQREIQQFHRDGFIIVKALANSELVNNMLQITNELIVRKTPPIEYEAELGYPGAPVSLNVPGGQTPRRFLQAICRHPILFEWATNFRVTTGLRQLLGANLVLNLAHHNAIMVKDPCYSSDTNWHQDMRYWKFQRPELISVLLSLTTAKLGNGCLRFLPGSHKLSIRSSQLDKYHFLKTDLPENKPLLNLEISVDLEPGDVIFFTAKSFMQLCEIDPVRLENL